MAKPRYRAKKPVVKAAPKAQEAPKAPPPTWAFTATSATQVTSPLFPPGVNPAPRVFYTPSVWHRIWLLVETCQQEVGWLGTVAPIPEGYLINDIYVPEQTVHGAETDISAEAMVEIAQEMLDNDLDPSTLRYWGHSHVNMGVTPSAQDERQIKDYLNGCSYFIRGIYNKRQQSKVDVFDTTAQVVHQCVSNQPYIPALTAEEKDALLQLVKDRVHAAPLRSVITPYGYYSGNTSTNAGPSQQSVIKGLNQGRPWEEYLDEFQI